MTAGKNYYEILELGKNASSDEIKKSYKRLARLYHPDTNPNDRTLDEKFKAVNEAHVVLGNPQKRKEYDSALLHPGKNTTSQSNNQDMNDFLNKWDDFTF